MHPHTTHIVISAVDAAKVLSFLYFPSNHTSTHPIEDDDDYSSISSEEGTNLQSPTIYVAIITRRDGSVKTKYLNPSAVSQHNSIRLLRGRKRAFSASSLFTKKSTLQKKAKHLLLWSKQEEGVSTSLVDNNNNNHHHISAFEALPNEVMIRILMHVDSTDLTYLQQASRKLYTLCHDNHVWYHLFCDKFQRHDVFSHSHDYRKLYREALELHRRWHQGHSQVSYLSKVDSHKDSVYSMAWMMGHDGGMFASASRDRTIKVWQKQGTCMLTRSTPHTGSILSIATSRHIAVTGSSDTTCTVWRLPEWQVMYRFEDHEDSVLSAVILDDHVVATGSRDCTLRIWNA